MDDVVINELAEITIFDFESDLNVNILGHIFEQSISDIEEIKSAISGEPNDKKKSKRKKEGIYYTPEYITRYIVEQAVGGWLKDKKEGLGFNKLKVGHVKHLRPKKGENEIELVEKKTGKARRITMNKTCIAAVKDLLSSGSYSDEDYLFQSQRREVLTVPSVHRLSFLLTTQPFFFKEANVPYIAGLFFSTNHSLFVLCKCSANFPSVHLFCWTSSMIFPRRVKGL